MIRYTRIREPRCVPLLRQAPRGTVLTVANDQGGVDLNPARPREESDVVRALSCCVIPCERLVRRPEVLVDFVILDVFKRTHGNLLPQDVTENPPYRCSNQLYGGGRAGVDAMRGIG